MKIKPLGRYVVAKVTEYDDPSNGIVIPDKYKKKIPKGIIIDVSDMLKDEFSIGETIIFEKSNTKLIENDLVFIPDYRIHLKQEL